MSLCSQISSRLLMSGILLMLRLCVSLNVENFMIPVPSSMNKWRTVLRGFTTEVLLAKDVAVMVFSSH